MIDKINEFYIKKKLTEKNCKLNKKVKFSFDEEQNKIFRN